MAESDPPKPGDDGSATPAGSVPDLIMDLALSQIENYRRQPAELVSHFNRESSAGRLSGPTAAGTAPKRRRRRGGPEAGCRLHIDLSRDRLLVANTGCLSARRASHRSSSATAIPKQLDRNRFIGCKGLGFRSVLAWTDRPAISSGPYDVAFDRSWAIGVVQTLAKGNAAIADIVLPFQAADSRWPAAVMRFPAAQVQTTAGWGNAGLACRRLRHGGRDPARRRRTWRRDSPRDPGAVVACAGNALLFCRHLTRVEITGDYIQTWELLREDHGIGSRHSHPAAGRG